MIGEEIKDTLKEVTIEDLRKITWDYSDEDIIGLYSGEIIRQYMWEAKHCSDVNPFVITKCNVEEGWVEHIEYEKLPNSDAKNITHFFKAAVVKRDKDGNPIRTKVNCKVVVDLLDAKGNVVVTLS